MTRALRGQSGRHLPPLAVLGVPVAMLGGLLAILGIVLCLLMASVVHHHMPPASVAAGEPMVMDDVDHVSLPPAVTTVTARAVGFAGLAAPAGPVRHLRHTIFQPPEGA